ncbi:hypothetical protein KKG48_00225 [Patescibacteria group bacterium]|nr:hypothetical protein [Patescibacteria group bacterium]MCG2695150.1 hypothetical protein [Candidatus Parcubacteria bacterium]
MLRLVCFSGLNQLSNNLFKGELPIGCFPSDSDFCEESGCVNNGLIIHTTKKIPVTFSKIAEKSIDITRLSPEDLDPFFLAGEDKSGVGWVDYQRPFVSQDDRRWLEQNGVPF